MKVLNKIFIVFFVLIIALIIKGIFFESNIVSAHTESIKDIISKYESGEAVIGIDVSRHQADIDWRQVADSGVKFAMIRCAYRGLTGGAIYEDSYFRKNVEGAINNGIYVGVYFYSTALNETEAIEEAQVTLNMVKGYDIKYPIAYDFENFEVDNNRTDNLPVDQINRNAHAFLSYIRANGYMASLYGSANYLKNIWDMNSFEAAGYDTWVAHYYVNQTSYNRRYHMWQYTDAAIIPGISTPVDVDIDYAYYFMYNNVNVEDYMFDATFYADLYSDLKNSLGYNERLLKEHYYTYGKREGRMATPIFDPKFYLEHYPDVREAYGNNYIEAYNHFVYCGAKEGRKGSKYFDPTYYINNNPDLKRAFYSSKTLGIRHYMTSGYRENRVTSSTFNVIEFKKTQPDYIRNMYGSNAKKYIIIAMQLPDTKPSNQVPFYDIKIDAFYYNALVYMYKNKYITGTTSVSFTPTQDISRAMLVTILWNMEGKPQFNDVSKFSDATDTNAFYYKAMIWATSTGVVNGNQDGTFAPNRYITRQEIATMLTNYCKYKGKYVESNTDLGTFSDNYRIAPWSKTSIQWAVQNKIIHGTDNGTKISPVNTATRAEAVTMLKNYIDNIK